MTQTLTLKRAPTGVDSAKLFVDGTDTLATNGTATSVTPGTNNPTRYSIVWGTNVADGTYQLVLYDGGVAVAGADVVVSGSNVTEINEVSEILSSVTGGIVTSVSVVTSQGLISGPLVIGDEYLQANGRALIWYIDPVQNATIGNCTFEFGVAKVASPDKVVFVAIGTLEAVTIEGEPKWKAVVELTNANTVLLRPVTHSWTATVVNTSSRITFAYGSVNVVRSNSD